MANYVENIKVGSGETWPVRDADAQEKITGLQTSLTTTNAAVNAAQTSANNAQTAADNAQTAADNAAANSWMLNGGTEIPEGADLFTYTTPGNYYCTSNVTAKTFVNCPVTLAFSMKVHAGTGLYNPNYSWRAIRVELRPYDILTCGLVWYADAVTSDSGANWTWSGWHQAADAAHTHLHHQVTTTGTDLNDYRLPGTYCFSSAYTPTNIPTGVNGFLVVIPETSAGGGAVKQIWYRTGTSGSNNHHTFERIGNAAGEWSAWTQYMTMKGGDFTGTVKGPNIADTAVRFRNVYVADSTGGNIVSSMQLWFTKK